MANLDKKIILVAGGTGNVGEGITAHYLKEGATVVVPSRKQESLDNLSNYLGDLAKTNFVPIIGNISTAEGVNKVRDDVLKTCGRLDGVLASIGGWWTGNKPLTEVSMEVWQQYIDSNLTSHFLLAKTFLPVLAKEKTSSYILLGGTAAEVPLKNLSPVGIPAAAQLMLARIIIEENKGNGIRINEVIVQGMVKTRAMEAHSSPEWITPEEIAQFTAWLSSDEGYMVSGSILNLNQRPR
ncbi:MAG: SDR family oxidoreductase [Cyanobacteriota bacterium ELA615]|jgi:3-oxoacyl-[acyl-carrier protein] reductase